MKPVLLPHRSTHHADHSGYDKLIDYIDAEQISGNQFFLPYRLAKFIGDNSNQNSGFYDSSSVYKDLKLFKTLLTLNNKSRIVHYLNAERDIRFIANWASYFQKIRMYATFHKPPEILSNQIKDIRYLKRLNGVIAVGANQVDFLKDWLNIENVKYIPHGVDTTFFVPDLTIKKEKTLLFVGQHLRDFEALNYSIKILQKKISELKVDIVLRKDYAKFIEPNNIVTIHSNIDDLQLKKLYQKASILFLPLINATACNSILEALACGTPIITTDVGGNSEYLSGTGNILAPTGDYDYLIDATISLLENKEKLLSIGNASREKSLDYDWKVVANQISDFYKTI